MKLPTGELIIECGLYVDDDGDTSEFPSRWVEGIQPFLIVGTV